MTESGLAILNALGIPMDIGNVPGSDIPGGFTPTEQLPQNESFPAGAQSAQTEIFPREAPAWARMKQEGFDPIPDVLNGGVYTSTPEEDIQKAAQSGALKGMSPEQITAFYRHIEETSKRKEPREDPEVTPEFVEAQLLGYNLTGTRKNHLTGDIEATEPTFPPWLDKKVNLTQLYATIAKAKAGKPLTEIQQQIWDGIQSGIKEDMPNIKREEDVISKREISPVTYVVREGKEVAPDKAPKNPNWKGRKPGDQMHKRPESYFKEYGPGNKGMDLNAKDN